LLALSAGLPAQLEFFPQTMVGETFVNTTNTSCNDALAGMDLIRSHYTTGEFFDFRLYTNSGGLSNPYSEARFDYYNIGVLPTTIFNGMITVTGGGPAIIDGTEYTLAMHPLENKASPVKLEITDVNPVQGIVSGVATMLSSTYALDNQFLRFFLIEDNVSGTATRVVRELITQNIALSGLGNSVNFTADFTSDVSGNPENFWAAVMIQLIDQSIVQAVSTLPQPDIQIRAVLPFDNHIVSPANYNYTSEPIWFFNTGSASDFTIRLLPDDTPADWYLNYCSEDGACYPGFIPNTFHLEPDSTRGFHLNLIIGAAGTATFHFIVEAAGMEPYIIPFTYVTGEAADDDIATPVAPLALSGNYPNPFSGSTVFRLDAKRGSNPVEIEIYNTKGQKVSSLTTGNLNTGTNLINWTASDAEGKALPQGVYFSRLKGSNTSSHKLLILNK
jgi:hypothetical protein